MTEQEHSHGWAWQGLCPSTGEPGRSKWVVPYKRALLQTEIILNFIRCSFGWLFSDNPTGEEAACGGPGLAWLHVWGRLDIPLSSLKIHWMRLMVENLTKNYLATALVDIPAVSMPITHSFNLRHLWYCAVTQLHILWDFNIHTTRCTCVMIMLFNQRLDMPHLSRGWIILVKEKCLLTRM